MVVRIHPREPALIMRTRWILILAAATSLAASCKTGEASGTTTADAVDSSPLLGCDHDLKIDTIVKHSWPYPADYRNLRWGPHYRKTKLKLKPTNAAFVTATVTWKQGEVILIEDSQLRITKPRRLVAKRDLLVKRKVWDQGIQVERTYLAAAEGEVGSFLFYNSRGLCMVDTPDGPGWMPCTLDDAFEGLSEEHPHACEQIWWAKVRKSKLNQGWMIVDSAFMERIPPPGAEAK